MTTRDEGARGTTATFRSEAPHATYWLELVHPEDEEPGALLAGLAEVGWERDPGMVVPAVGGTVVVTLESPGSGEFGAWGSAERRAKPQKAVRVLARHGIEGVRHVRLSLSDMM